MKIEFPEWKSKKESRRAFRRIRVWAYTSNAFLLAVLPALVAGIWVDWKWIPTAVLFLAASSLAGIMASSRLEKYRDISQYLTAPADFCGEKFIVCLQGLEAGREDLNSDYLYSKDLKEIDMDLYKAAHDEGYTEALDLLRSALHDHGFRVSKAQPGGLPEDKDN